MKNSLSLITSELGRIVYLFGLIESKLSATLIYTDANEDITRTPIKLLKSL